MEKRKTGAAMGKMQPDIKAVKAEEHPPEESPAGEPGAEKTEEPLPDEEPTGETGAEKAEEPSPEEELSGESGARSPVVYKIVCRNKITKRIGGVDFLDGEGFTFDGYAQTEYYNGAGTPVNTHLPHSHHAPPEMPHPSGLLPNYQTSSPDTEPVPPSLAHT